MEFSKPEAYMRQISIYLKEQMDQQAYDLSKEFVKKFPGELLPHILLAESAFRLKRFDECKVEARKALKYAKTENDIRFCTMIFSTACFQRKDYIEGYETLKAACTGKFIPEVEEILLVFSIAMADEAKAIRHMQNLMVLNRSRAMQLMKDYDRQLEAAKAEQQKDQQ